MSEIIDEIESLRSLGRNALIERYRAETGREPRQKNAAWLVRRLAWREQEKRLGGLSATARATLDCLIGEIDLPTGETSMTTTTTKRVKARAIGISLGTTLTRIWHDREVRVTSVDGGFEHDGVVYKSLSAATKAITSQKWNPSIFWNLTPRKRA